MHKALGGKSGKWDCGKVHISDVNNSSGLETCALPGQYDPGIVQVQVDENNRIIKEIKGHKVEGANS